MTVEKHVYVVVDEDGRPARAFTEKAQAEKVVESDSYTDEHIVDMYPDIPVIREEMDDDR